MTPAEIELMVACGEFCHVTTADGMASIEAVGLAPAFDVSQVIRGPRKDKAVYPCPAASLDKAMRFLGSRADDQPKLYVYRIGAAELAVKDCGADISWLVNLVDEDQWTVAVSMELGSIACYDPIARAELTDPLEVDNPKYTAPGGGDVEFI
jgi:hypothetical protein